MSVGDRSYRVERRGDDLVLTGRPVALLGPPLLGVYLAFLTVGCVLQIRWFFDRPSPASLVGYLPFWAAWVLLLRGLVRAWPAREELRAGPDGLDYRRSSRWMGESRRVPLGEIRAVGTTASEVRIDALGLPLRFARHLGHEERARIAGLILDHLRAVPAAPPIAPEVRGASWVKPSSPGETCGPPSDCRLRRRGDVFTRRGRFDPVTVLGFLIANCVWNGLIGYLLLQLSGGPHRFFLILVFPHVLIGLGLLWGLLASIVAPFWHETLSVRPGGPVYRNGWLRPRRLDASAVGRVQVRAYPTQHDPTETTYSLEVMGRDGKQEWLVIPGLTEGEARWIGSEAVRIIERPAGDDAMFDRWIDP
jgi:hypothetical protein